MMTFEIVKFNLILVVSFQQSQSGKQKAIVLICINIPVNTKFPICSFGSITSRT